MRATRSDGSSSSRTSSKDYGQGWTQYTDHGKIYLSKKEKNVFILEGTAGAGFSACNYGGTPEQRAFVESGSYTLTIELKCVPSDSCPEQHVYVLLDCQAVTDLSSGCDFCGVKLCFGTRELRVENHRRNVAVQTLYAQPGCVLLRPQTYVTLAISVAEDTCSLALSGVTVVSNLPMGRLRSPGSDPSSVGVAVYGRTRTCLRRFRISATSAPPQDDSAATGQARPCGSAAPPLSVRKSASSSFRRSNTGGLEAPVLGSDPGLGPPLAAASVTGSSFAFEDMELAATIERDIVVADLNVRFEDIGGLADAKRAINEAVVLPLILPEFFVGLRTPWKGVLLFGPPGTGKTMLAKAVASCTENITFFNCSSATLTSKWRGESEKLLRALFVTARAKVPAILFFDEIDSLLSQRGSSAEHEASRRFKSEFLIHMDGLLSDAKQEGEPPGHLLVLATSNTPWDLDEALRRRLEKRIYIPLPDEEARLGIFKGHLKDINLGEDVDFENLAKRADRYSGADIQLLCREASMNPMRRLIDGLSPAELVRMRDEGTLTPDSVPIEMADFEAALKSVQPSVGASDTQRFVDWARDFGSK